MTSKALYGARCRFKINGQKMAYAGGVSGDEQIDYEPIDVLDLLEVLEHVPIAYRANFNANFFRVVGNSLKNQGIFPIQNNILTSGALEASAEDRLTGRTIALFQGVRTTTKNFDLQARARLTENAAFVAIRMLDESTV